MITVKIRLQAEKYGEVEALLLNAQEKLAQRHEQIEYSQYSQEEPYAQYTFEVFESE